MIWLLLWLAGCTHSECERGDYSSAECRVLAENENARMRTSSGVEVRFQSPGANLADTWQALGLVTEIDEGVVRLRPATLMNFAISLEPSEDTTLTVVLDNVAPDTIVRMGPVGSEVDTPFNDVLLSRTLNVDLTDDTIWIRGERPCPADYRLVAAGDVQTNPDQFERVVEDLHRQKAEADEAGQPLLGFLLLGDVVQDPNDSEFERIEDILVRSPIPVSVLPGNHDIYGDSFGLYNRWFGPGNYAFDVCRTRVAMLDSGGGDLAPSVEARLPELLDKGDRDFLIGGTHYPAYADRTGAGFRDSMQATYLLSEAARNGMDRLLTGHVHYWAEYPAIDTGSGLLHEIITGTAGANQGSGSPHYGVTRLTFTDSVDSCFDELLAPGRAETDPSSAVPITRCTD
jgi:hypothetical protein